MHLCGISQAVKRLWIACYVQRRMLGKFGHFCFYYVRHASDVSARSCLHFWGDTGPDLVCCWYDCIAWTWTCFERKEKTLRLVEQWTSHAAKLAVVSPLWPITVATFLTWLRSILKCRKHCSFTSLAMSHVQTLLKPHHTNPQGSNAPMSSPPCHVMRCGCNRSHNLLVIEVTPLNQSGKK